MTPASTAKASTLKANRVCVVSPGRPCRPLPWHFDEIWRKTECCRGNIYVLTHLNTSSSSLFPFLSYSQSLFTICSPPLCYRLLVSVGETFKHMKIDTILSLSKHICVNRACYISVAGKCTLGELEYLCSAVLQYQVTHDIGFQFKWQILAFILVGLRSSVGSNTHFIFFW